MASQTAYSTWTPQKPTLFDGHYLRNRSTLDIVVFGYIGIVQHKEHSPEVLSIPPGTPCIYLFTQGKPAGTSESFIIIIIGTQPLGRSGQRPEFSQATGMALVRCILGKFLGVVCHCFPPRIIYCVIFIHVLIELKFHFRSCCLLLCNPSFFFPPLLFCDVTVFLLISFDQKCSLYLSFHFQKIHSKFDKKMYRY